jgi:cation-transporting ATPase E
MATLLFVSQLVSFSSTRAALRGAVVGTVAMVPEGLVLLTSVAFAVGVVRLGRRSVLVQELPAIEGLDRVDIRFAVPAGLMAAAATLAAYGLVRNEGVGLAEARTVATIVLFWIGLVVLMMVAAPLTLPRRSLVVAMGVAFLAVMAVASIRGFFGLILPSGIEWLAAVGIAAIVATGLRVLIPDRTQPRASDDSP